MSIWNWIQLLMHIIPIARTIGSASNALDGDCQRRRNDQGRPLLHAVEIICPIDHKHEVYIRLTRRRQIHRYGDGNFWRYNEQRGDHGGGTNSCHWCVFLLLIVIRMHVLWIRCNEYYRKGQFDRCHRCYMGYILFLRIWFFFFFFLSFFPLTWSTATHMKKRLLHDFWVYFCYFCTLRGQAHSDINLLHRTRRCSEYCTGWQDRLDCVSRTQGHRSGRRDCATNGCRGCGEVEGNDWQTQT